MQSYDVIGIGNALVDIEVQVEEKFLTELQARKGGMTLSTPADQNRILDAVADHPRKVASGGSAANTIHGIGALGGHAYYLGRVADDSLGRHYTQDMKDCGVGFPGPDAQPEGTGTCVILITPDTERTMFTHLGISSRLHPDNVDETLVGQARAVYIEGYLWTGEETRASALKMAEAAKKARVPVAFTLSDAFVVNMAKEDITDFIRWNVDILFCNEVEAFAMAGTENPDRAFDQLRGMVDTLFMTRGREGSWAANGQGERVSIGTFPVKAVDTTGAGDLFAAGALYGLVRKHTLKESGILGAYCAAQVVSHFGGRMPPHSHTDVRKILDLYSGP